MTAYVRVCKHAELVSRIDDTGLQVEVAAAAGLTTQRVNQIYTGACAVLEVRKARALEDALGVPHGTFFAAVDGPLLAPYVHDTGPRAGLAGVDDPAPAPPAVHTAA